MAKAVEEAGDVPEDATAALLITGLKRPFTPNMLAQVLSETGIVKGEKQLCATPGRCLHDGVRQHRWCRLPHLHVRGSLIAQK